jgi:hypothetical protein
VGGATAGAVVPLAHKPGRKLQPGEDVSGKVVWRRSKIPLIRHYGVGVAKDKVLHVQHHMDPKTKKRLGSYRAIVPLAKFAQESSQSGELGKVRQVYVQNKHRLTDKQRARLRGYAATKGKPFEYNVEDANCETLANEIARIEKPSNQVRDAKIGIIAGGLAAGGIAAVAALRKTRFEELKPDMIEFDAEDAWRKAAIYGGAATMGVGGYYLIKKNPAMQKAKALVPLGAVIAGGGLIKIGANRRKKGETRTGALTRTGASIAASAVGGPIGAVAGEKFGEELAKDVTNVKKKVNMEALQPGMIEFRRKMTKEEREQRQKTKRGIGGGMVAAGVTSAALGTHLLPAGISMLRLRGRQYTPQGRQIFKESSKLGWGGKVPNQAVSTEKHAQDAAEFIAAYSETGAKFAETLPGMTVRRGLQKGMSRAIANPPPAGAGAAEIHAHGVDTFGKSHALRFIGQGQREALKHWDWEVSQQIKGRKYVPDMKETPIRRGPKIPRNKLTEPLLKKKPELEEGIFSGTKKTYPQDAGSFKGERTAKRIDAFHDQWNRGREKFNWKLDEMLTGQAPGMEGQYPTLSKAVRQIGKDPDPDVQQYLITNAFTKRGQVPRHAKEAALAPALLLAGGGATIPGAIMMRGKKDKKKKMKNELEALQPGMIEFGVGERVGKYVPGLVKNKWQQTIGAVRGRFSMAAESAKTASAERGTFKLAEATGMKGGASAAGAGIKQWAKTLFGGKAREARPITEVYKEGFESGVKKRAAQMAKGGETPSMSPLKAGMIGTGVGVAGLGVGYGAYKIGKRKKY